MNNDIGKVGLWFLLILGPLVGWAQNLSISGTLVDKEDAAPVFGATVLLTNVKDTTDYYFTSTDQDGTFKITDLVTAFYKLRITSIGYQPHLQYVRLQQDLSLGTVSLNQDTRLLNEVEIKGQVVPITQKGDTTQINALAYKTNPDANAEDLIAKMPGIIVSDGNVQAQGEDVKKVLVDGKEFFSNDPTLALKSLPAEIIDKIEVFDQLSEQSQFSGFDDGNTTKTINIVTKVNMRNGQFGRGYAGYGNDARYKLGGNLNFFDDDRRITVLGLANNINQQNFSNEDLLGVVSSSGGGRRRGRGGPGGGGRGQGGNSSANFMTGQQGGISETQSFGLNFNDQFSEKLSLNGSYFFNRTDNENTQGLSRETFIGADSSQFYDEVYNADNINNNHRLTMRLDYKIDEKNSILFTPKVSFQSNESSSSSQGNTLSQAGTMVNSATTSSTSDLSGFNLSGDVLYRHRFEKRGRTLSLNIGSQVSGNDGESYQRSVNQYFLTDRQDSLNQFADKYGSGKTWSGNLIYTEPLTDRMQLQLNYGISKSKNSSEKETYGYDFESEVIQALDTALSNNFESEYTTHKPTIGLMYRGEDLMLRGGITYQHATLSSIQKFPVATTIDRSFETLLPSLMLRYTISKEKNLRLFFRSNTDAPSVSQLQDVIDNSDPLFLTSGNSALDQSKTNMLAGRYSYTNSERSSSFSMMMMVRNTSDYVTSATYVAQQDSVLSGGVLLNQGAQLSTPVNLNGYWNVRIFSSYGMPLAWLGSNLNTHVGFTYTRTPGYTNNVENISNSYNINGGLVLGSNISENVDFTLSYTADYTQVSNTLQPDLEDDYVSHTVGGKVNLIAGSSGFLLRSDINYIQYTGYSDESLNDSYILWNASIGKKFLKENRGELALTVFDLLGQNTSISRTNTESYFEETRTEVLQQYFMATFTYTLRNFRDNS